ncbi:MAG TPA: class I SAM-dependent methyltransferase [Streptosporangiaceae bacterium]|jgi:SAM-dependent methyltransferase
MADLEFRRDLYQGTARYYDRFRVPYPPSLIEDLARRAGAGGAGAAGKARLLDLACGTGQLAFPLCGYFAEVWAVDQEPGMIEVVTEKMRAAGIGNIRPLAASAEGLNLPEGSFDLVVMGNAFHRVCRETVAANVHRWLRPGGLLALVWSRGPSDGGQPWQRVLSATMARWQKRARAQARVPSGYEADRIQRPDGAVLRDAGFELAGYNEFPVTHEWVPETLTGYLFSTSLLSPVALGDLAPGFEHDLRRELLSCEPSGRFEQVIDFAYELARRPG